MTNLKNTNLHEYFKGKKVLIMGLGLLGGSEGVARFFAEAGALVTVTDLKTKDELKETLSRLKDLPINYVLGKHRASDFKDKDLIIRNPDVPRDSEFLKIARQEKIPVEMDESLFLKLCPICVIGVTGTRGKTTTTTMIGEILKAAGFHTLLGGNLSGVATLSLLPQITPRSKVVLELSSWQLQGLDQDRISPHIAVITNIYPDHLNRYKDMDEYIADKKLIFKYQNEKDFLILNSDNEVTQSFDKMAKSRVIWFSGRDWPKGWPLKVLGEHNRENAIAACIVGKLMGVDDKTVKEALGNFVGVPHRLEIVRELNGTIYIDDSTSTTPIAGIMALKACAKKPIILIAGGNSKKLDLSEFAGEIVKRVKSVVLLEGTATDDLEEKLKVKSAKLKILGKFKDFEKAVLVARNFAKPGDVVLLSPGCTSFGMFKNEFDRGEKFKQIVKDLN